MKPRHFSALLLSLTLCISLALPARAAESQSLLASGGVGLELNFASYGVLNWGTVFQALQDFTLKLCYKLLNERPLPQPDPYPSESENSLTAGDAVQCLQAELDAAYKGIFDGLLEFYEDITPDEAQEQYDANTLGEAQYFLFVYGPVSAEDTSDVVPFSEAQLLRAQELYQKIYAKSDYTVLSSTRQSDGSFLVEVRVKPLDILVLLEHNYEDGFEDFWKTFDTVDTERMSDEEFITWYESVFSPAYYDTLLDLLEQELPHVGYGAEKRLFVPVGLDEDGAVLIDNGSYLSSIDQWIIDYNL